MNKFKPLIDKLDGEIDKLVDKFGMIKDVEDVNEEWVDFMHQYYTSYRGVEDDHDVLEIATGIFKDIQHINMFHGRPLHKKLNDMSVSKRFALTTVNVIRHGNSDIVIQGTDNELQHIRKRMNETFQVSGKHRKEPKGDKPAGLYYDQLQGKNLLRLGVVDKDYSNKALGIVITRKKRKEHDDSTHDDTKRLKETPVSNFYIEDGNICFVDDISSFLNDHMFPNYNGKVSIELYDGLVKLGVIGNAIAKPAIAPVKKYKPSKFYVSEPTTWERGIVFMRNDIEKDLDELQISHFGKFVTLLDVKRENLDKYGLLGEEIPNFRANGRNGYDYYMDDDYYVLIGGDVADNLSRYGVTHEGNKVHTAYEFELYYSMLLGDEIEPSTKRTMKSYWYYVNDSGLIDMIIFLDDDVIKDLDEFNIPHNGRIVSDLHESQLKEYGFLGHQYDNVERLNTIFGKNIPKFDYLVNKNGDFVISDKFKEHFELLDMYGVKHNGNVIPKDQKDYFELSMLMGKEKKKRPFTSRRFKIYVYDNKLYIVGKHKHINKLRKLKKKVPVVRLKLDDNGNDILRFHATDKNKFEKEIGQKIESTEPLPSHLNSLLFSLYPNLKPDDQKKKKEKVYKTLDDVYDDDIDNIIILPDEDEDNTNFKSFDSVDSIPDDWFEFRGNSQFQVPWCSYVNSDHYIDAVAHSHLFKEGGIYYIAVKRPSKWTKHLQDTLVKTDNKRVMINSNFMHQLKLYVLDTNKVFLTFVIHEFSVSSRHANALMINPAKKTIYRMEPHGHNTNTYSSAQCDADIVQAIAGVEELKDFKYYGPRDFQADNGPQAKELWYRDKTLYPKITKKFGSKERLLEAGGFCMAWSIYVLHMYVINLPCNFERLYEYFLHDPTANELAEVIRRFQGWLVKMAKSYYKDKYENPTKPRK